MKASASNIAREQGAYRGQGAYEFYMKEALAQAKMALQIGEVPIGAVVVYDPVDPATRKYINEKPRIIAKAYNMRESKKDPSAHAEFLAMLEAARVLNVWRLHGCTVYCTLEPCIMCAGLMHQARIDACIYGATDKKAGALGSLYNVHSDARLNHTFSVTSGVMGKDCAQLLKEFFKVRREKQKERKQKSK